MPILNTFNSVSVRGFATVPEAAPPPPPIPPIGVTFLVLQGAGARGLRGFLTEDGASTWTQVTVPSGEYQAAGYANGQYVAINRGNVSSSGEGVITSSDGITWTKTLNNMPGTNLNWNGIAYGNRWFAIAPGSTSAGAYSANPTATWTGVNLPGASQTWQSMASNGATTIAVGLLTNRTIRTTNYGGSWANAGNLPANTSHGNIAFGGGSWIAVRSSGLSTNIGVRSTNNGTSWANITLPVTTFWQSLVYGNGWFVALGSPPIGARSTNGTTWSTFNLPSGPAWQTLGYNNGVFLAVARNPSGTCATARSTDNGATWTTTTSLPDDLSTVTVVAGRNPPPPPPPPVPATFLVTQGFGTTSSEFYLTENGGNSWQIISVPTSVYQAVTFADNQYVALSRGSPEFTLTSSDGINWTRTNNNLPGTNGPWNTVGYGTQWFAAGSSTQAARTSNPAGTWSSVTTPSSNQWIAATANGATAVMGIQNSRRTARSTNSGTSWLFGGNLVTITSMGDMTFGAGQFLAVANGADTGGTSTNRFNRSTNGGGSWGTITAPSTARWSSITYGNGWFVAVANGTASAGRSSNGTTWSPITLPASESWTSVDYNNGVFFAAAIGGATARSTDNGATWVSGAPLPTAVTNRVIVTGGPIPSPWTGGSIVIMGSSMFGNAFVTSDPYRSWTRVSAAPSTVLWSDVIYTGNTIVAMPGLSTDSNAYISTNSTTWNAANLGTTDNWRTVGGYGSTYVAISRYGNNLSRSTNNGTTWSLLSGVTMPVTSSVDWVSMETDGSSRLVAVAYNVPYCATSDDLGSTWTQRTMPNGQWYAIARGNGIFMITSWSTTNNVVISSDNGTTWSRPTATSTGQASYSLAYGNNTWISGGSSSRVSISNNNGASWRTVSVPLTSTARVYVRYFNNFFFVYGSVGQQTAVSYDNGNTWTNTAQLPSNVGTTNGSVYIP